MKRAFLITVCVLTLVATDSFGREQPLANEGKAGLYAKSIEQVLRLEANEIDLGTAALIISEQWSQVVPGRNYQAQLDDMAFEIRDRLKARGLEANYRAVPVINRYLFEEQGFKSIPQASEPNDLFLHTVLDKKRGYCLSLSILYLAIGERLGLPLYGVVVPGHFFVRYNDGRVRFNIETTSKGGSAPDEHYIKKFKVPTGSRDSIYMVNLNNMQTLGCFFNNLGNSYSDIGDTQQAQVVLETAVQINPSLAESRTNLGNIYLKKERIEDAMYEYQAALRINPDDTKTHNNLGNAYVQRGWLNDAISQYHRSLQLDPNFVDVYKNLANAYCKQAMFALAEVQLKQAIVLEPKNAGCHSQLGNVYSQMGDCERAIAQYKKALKINGRLAEAYYGLGICYNKVGRSKDEISAYKKALAIEPNMAAALVNLGNAYFEKNKYDAAIEQYKKAVRIMPQDGMIYYNLGAAYSNREEYQQAVIEYRKAVEIEPKMGDAHNGLAWGLYKLKKYEQAAKHIKIAEELGVEIDKDLAAAIAGKLK